MITGTVLGMIGSIICATANSILVLIGGNVFLGSASAFQTSFSYVLQELVPMRYRYIGMGLIYPWTIVGSGFSPTIAYAFINKYEIGWRGVYWLLLAVNGVALFCWAAFYFPPTFEEKHKSDINSKRYWVKNFDYLGTFLFSAGTIVFLLGLSWGGSVYPWKSAVSLRHRLKSDADHVQAVISAIIIGVAVLVAFVLWEIYGPTKQPLMPMRLFLNSGWSATAILMGLGAGIYVRHPY